MYLAVSFNANGDVDRDLHSEAAAVASDLRFTNGRVTYAGGAMPHESSNGEVIDMAVVAPSGVFARADSARARDGDGGVGLGLPLSLAFARVQGGELRLVEMPGWGAVLQLWLPDARPDAGRWRVQAL